MWQNLPLIMLVAIPVLLIIDIRRRNWARRRKEDFNVLLQAIKAGQDDVLDSLVEKYRVDAEFLHKTIRALRIQDELLRS